MNTSIIVLLLFLTIITLIMEIERNKSPSVSIKNFYAGDKFQTFLISLNNACIHLFDGRCILPVKDYKQLNPLENHRQTIAREFFNVKPLVTPTQPSVFDDSIEYDKNYGYYFLKYANHMIVENEKYFPKLYQILKDTPSIKTAFFSIIQGPKHIPTHRGPSKGYLRYHLTIHNDNPSKNYLQVKERKCYWKSNSSFLFDDTFYHKLDKKDNGLRVSLICDVERNLSRPLKFLNQCTQRSLQNSNYVKERINKLKL